MTLPCEGGRTPAAALTALTLFVGFAGLALIGGCDLPRALSPVASHPLLQDTRAALTPAASLVSGPYVVVSVADGDTITIANTAAPGGRQRVRILGINAPEIAHDGSPAQCFGLEAKQLADRLLYRARVTLTTDPVADDVDRYGRLLRYVATPGVPDIGAYLIARGAAVEYHPASAPVPTLRGSYEETERVAAQASAGLWAHCPRPTRPRR